MFVQLKSMTVIILMTAFIVGGCYTKLMTPNEFVQTQRLPSKKTIADNSYSINYNQSCVSCHSVAELNERADELEYYGVRTVHDGVLLSANLWNNGPFDQSVIIQNPYWTNPYNPVNPWWVPPSTTVTTTTAPASGDGNRPRTGGPTRDGNRQGERSTPIQAPVYSQPQTPASGTTPTPTTPAPAVNVVPSTPPAQTNDSARSREGTEKTNSSNRTRNDGTSRDDSGDRPR